MITTLLQIAGVFGLLSLLAFTRMHPLLVMAAGAVLIMLSGS